MARLYANENFPLPAVERMRELGHDVITVAETGKAEQSWPDDAVLEFAVQDDRILITMNRKHFIRLHDEQPEHAGIIVCTFDPDFAALAQRVHDALANRADVSRELIRINRPSDR